jgi:hypothetical protein
MPKRFDKTQHLKYKIKQIDKHIQYSLSDL